MSLSQARGRHPITTKNDCCASQQIMPLDFCVGSRTTDFRCPRNVSFCHKRMYHHGRIGAWFVTGLPNVISFAIACTTRRLLRSKGMTDEQSEPGGVKVLRLYADALGESRFETTTMPMALKEFAPPAAPFRVSDPQPAQNYVILEVGAEWGGAVPHPSPARMMGFSLSGCTRVTAARVNRTHSSRAIVCYTTIPPARGIALKSYRSCPLDGCLSASPIRSTTSPRCPRWVLVVSKRLERRRTWRRTAHLFCRSGYARIAAMSGWMPTMFITRVTL